MFYLNVLFLITQCVVVGIILLTLFRVRTIFGLSLLLTTLGVFQYMQVFLANSFYFEIAPGIIVSSGSSVLFTGTLFTILLIYIREDALEARKVIYAILAANIILTILQYTINVGYASENFINTYSLPKIFFQQNIRVIIVGTTLLFLDTFFIIFIYEAVSKYIKLLFLRIIISMLFILSLDTILFALGAFSFSNNIQQIIISSLISKSIAALIYTTLLTIYIHFYEKDKIIIDATKYNSKDLFHSLTFRQKFEQVSKENKLQKEALEDSNSRYQYLVEQTSEGFYKIASKQAIPINLPVSEIIDQMYKYMYIEECNNLFAKLYGYNKASEVVGISFFELHKKKYNTANIKTLTKFIKSNFKISNNEVVRINKLGDSEYFLNNANGIIEDGKLLAFWGTQRDVTLKKKIEISLKEATKIINKSPAVAFLWRNDTVWSVEYVSTNIKNLSGYTSEEFLNKEINFFNIVHKDDIERVSQEVEINSKNANIQNFSHKPYRIITKKGEVKWVKDNSYIRRDEKGNITFYEGIIYDITEQQIAETTLKKERELFKALIDNIPVMLTLYEPDFNMLFLNNEFEIKTGYTIKNLKGANILEKIYPDSDYREQAIAFMNNKTNTWKEFLITTKSGETFNTEWRNINLENGIQIGIGIDITERKLAKNKLIEQKNFLELLINHMPNQVFWKDQNLVYQGCNKVFAEVVGFTNPKDVIGKTDYELNRDSKFADFYRDWDTLIISSGKSALNIEEKFTNYEGKTGDILTSKIPIINNQNQTLGVLGICVDITHRKLVENKLLEEKTKAQQYLNVAGIMLLSINKYGIVTLINPKGCEILEYNKEEIIGKNWFDNFIPKNDLSIIKNIAQKVFDGDLENTSYYENIIISKSGTKKMIAWHNEVLRDENNKIIGILSSGEDITERKRTEKELKLFNNRLQILHSLDLAILAAKPLNNIVTNVLEQLNNIIPFKIATLAKYNPEDKSFTRIKSITSFSSTSLNLDNEPIPISYYDLINLKTLEKGQTQILANIKKEFTNTKNVDYLELQNINSTIIIPLITEQKLIGTLNLGAKNISAFTLENIKIAKEIANQLAVSIVQNKLKQELKDYTLNLENLVKERTEQLEFSNSELRDFAQIVSHDLKAPLRAISQLSFWVFQDYSSVLDDTGKEHLQMLIGRVKRMDNLIDGILQYSKVGKSREKEIEINLQTIVNEVIESLHPPINIEIVFKNKLPTILGDPTRIGQVFQNLINNSIKFIDKPKGLITIGYTIEQDYYKFYVADNGPGIEEKYFEKIFQIFQRLESRDNQEGTGVGLSLVKRIVQIYGGEVWVESKLNEGATFYFTLPKKIVF